MDHLERLLIARYWRIPGVIGEPGRYPRAGAADGSGGEEGATAPTVPSESRRLASGVARALVEDPTGGSLVGGPDNLSRMPASGSGRHIPAVAPRHKDQKWQNVARGPECRLSAGAIGSPFASRRSR
jgi:hypothetical protein